MRSRRLDFILFQTVLAVAIAWSFADIFGSGPLGRLETQVGRNSEGFALAFLVLAEVRIRESGNRHSRIWLWWAILATAYLLTTHIDGLPASFATLNESFLAAILISIFLEYFGPSNSGRWPRRWIYPLAAATVAFIGELPIKGLEDLGVWIMNSAETWGSVLLITILIGFISSYPWPQVSSTAAIKVGWLLALCLIPVAGAVLNQNGVDSVAAVGPVESTLVWIQRITEAFIAALVLSLFFLLQERKTAESAKTEESL